MKLEIRNYKTIKHLCFEFTGFASIVGQNFIGKSAIAGALAACLQNSIDKTAIRDGEDYCEVLFEREGLSVFWHYEESNTYYLVNGEKFDKLDGTLPTPLVEAGYTPVSSGSEKEYLWYIEQFKPLFVVHKDKSNFSTDLLASIFKFDSVYKALDLCRKEIKSTKALEKLRTEDLKKARRDMVQVQRVEDLLPEIERTEALASGVRALGIEATSMRSISDRLRVAKEEASLLRGVPAVPVVEAGTLSDDIAALASDSRRLASMKSAAQLVRSLKPTQDLQDLSQHKESVAGLLQVQVSASALVNEYRSAETLTKSLEVALASSELDRSPYDLLGKGLSDVKAGRALLKELRLAKAYAETVKASLEGSTDPSLGGLVASIADVLSGLPDLRRMCAEKGAVESEVARLTQELSAAERESKALFDDLKEFKACPLCNKPYDAETECAHA